METNIQPGSRVKSNTGHWYKVIPRNEYKWDSLPSNAVSVEYGVGHQTYIYASSIVDVSPPAPKPKVAADRYTPGSEVQSRGSGRWYKVLSADEYNGKWAVPPNAVPIELGDGVHTYMYESNIASVRNLHAKPNFNSLPAGTVVANKAGLKLTLTGERGIRTDGSWYYKTVNPNHGVWPRNIDHVVSMGSKFDNLLSAVMGQSKPEAAPKPEPEAETDADDRETWNLEVLELAADFKRQVTFLYKSGRTPYAAWGDGLSTTRSFVPERIEYRDGKTYIVENDDDGYRTYRLDRIDGYVMVLAQ